jgi:predicted component of type VI protein secretion system
VEVQLTPGKTTQQKLPVSVERPFVRVLAENPDPAQSISRLTITATLGG